MTIERLECFTMEYTFSPRRGPSIAFSGEHSYVLVKLTDRDGIAGWGETYLVPGAAATIEALGPLLMGRRAQDALDLKRDVAVAAQDAYVSSAISIAIDDLRARQIGVPIYQLYGGARRDRIRAYGASGGYREGEDPGVTWPAEAAELVGLGYTAIKLRIGRYPLAHERPIYERLRRELPANVALMADGNAGYTFRQAIDTGKVLHELGFLWWEEPMHQWDGYMGYERLAAALEIALAGGEITMSRNAAKNLIERSGVDIFQPEPVICGGISETLFIADMARLNAISVVPHTSGSAIGIAAAVQCIAALPNPTPLTLHDMPMLEMGADPNPWRTDLLTRPIRELDGWVNVPTGPGLGWDVDEAFVRHRASEVRVVMAAN
jgi:D-galactarolactone cycloisomerase